MGSRATLDQNPQHLHIVAKLAARFLHQAKPPATSATTTWRCNPAKFARAEQVIQAIFYACVVSTSMDLGLIDLQHLYVSGDGSKLRTWANPNGRKHCTCDNTGKPPDEWRNGERYCRDPAARWGYDSYHDCWVYGHTYFDDRKIKSAQAMGILCGLG